MGSLRLYDIARKIVEGLESLPLTEAERALAPAEIWRAVLRAYVPGESLRAGSDRLVDVVPPGKKTNDETIAADQLSADRVRLFALHVVSLAISEWEQEAK